MASEWDFKRRKKNVTESNNLMINCDSFILIKMSFWSCKNDHYILKFNPSFLSGEFT